MAFKYSASRKSFTQMGALEKVFEDQVGWDKDTLIFPGVSSCTTITFRLSSKRVLGLHLTIGTPLDDVMALVDHVNANKRGNITDICFVGHLTTLGSGWSSDPKYQWPRQATSIKADAGSYAAHIHYRKLTQARDVRIEALSTGGFLCQTRAVGKGDEDWKTRSLSRL